MAIDHGLLALAAMYVGIPYAPIAPAYSLQAQEFTALRQVFDRMQPGLVFAADGARFERALRDVLPAGVELVTTRSAPADIPSTPFESLVATSATAGVDDARDRVGSDTIAKVLFTSGSTGRPKGVINTQRMLCSNQEMIRSVLAFLGDAPPVLCDWLPWNHTAGGNHNFGLVLYNGGTLYIDEGKPAPAQFAATLRNLREVPCTAHFEVPRFYEMLMPHLRSDAVLRDTFFRDLKLLFYAAAGLGQRFWDELREVSLEACGEELLIMTGFGVDRDRAVRIHDRPGRRVRRHGRLPRARARGEARAGRLEARSARARPQHHARLLARPGSDGRRIRRRRLLPARRRDAVRRSGRSGPRLDLRRPAGGGLQAVHRHVGQRRTAARADSRGGREALRRTSSSPATIVSLPAR